MRYMFAIFPILGTLTSALAGAASFVQGTVTASVKSYYIVDTGSNRLEIIKGRCPGLKPGDIVALPAGKDLEPYRTDLTNAVPIRKLGHRDLPLPPQAVWQEIDPLTYDKRNIRLRGWVKAMTIDQIDGTWIRMILQSGNNAIDIALPNPTNAPVDLLRYTYATVEVTGLFRRKISGTRRFAASSVELTDIGDVTILAPPPDDPYDYPSVTTLQPMSSAEIMSLGVCSASGTVLAVWGDRSFLMRTKGLVTRITLRSPEDLPSCGETIRAVGLVQTDLHHLILSDARCQRLPADLAVVDPPTPLDSRQVANLLDTPSACLTRHGQCVRLSGIIRNVRTSSKRTVQLLITCGETPVTVNTSGLKSMPKGLSVGCTLELTATVVAETEPWLPGQSVDTFRDVMFVPRSASDLRILARPTWWTPERLLAVILSLVAVLVGFFVWNRILIRLVNRRGHELFRSEYARVSAVLRISERTRLATELHDSLSQSIAGIACQVVAAKHALNGNSSAVGDRLSAAENMLASCRNELSNCLFDLRGDMLEEPDFSTAVRKSLSLVAGAADRTAIRMNISRTHLHDATAHAILCIIRELVSNALRHGMAEHVRVAGCIDNGRLLFSVADDGTGFDEATCLGPDRGHFGLTGIRDRVRKLKGTIRIESSSRGTRVIISLPKPANVQKTDQQT